MTSTSVPHRAPENKVLSALGNTESAHFCPQLERVCLSQGEVVYEPDTDMKYVYFPETAVFSLLVMTADGATVEVGPVGDEGMVGLEVFMGAYSAHHQVIVHVAGSAMRLPAEALGGALDLGGAKLWRLLTRYARMLLAMTSQSAACYKLHTVEQQLARWILTMGNYADGGELQLTHELIGLTLGMRRASVSQALGALKTQGIVDNTRGLIQIRDREKLRGKACECYPVIKGEFDRLYADLARNST